MVLAGGADGRGARFCSETILQPGMRDMFRIFPIAPRTLETGDPAVARSLRLAALLVFFLCCAGRGLAGDSAPLPKADEVVRGIVERARNREVRRATAAFRYTQRRAIDKYDEKGAVKEHEDRRYEVEPLEGASYTALVEKNGRPLAGTDLTEEKEKRRRFIERQTARNLGKSEEERVPLDAELFARYRGEVVGREVMGGRPAIVMEFSPKSRDLPIHRRQDYLLNKLAGKVWVDEKDYDIVKVEARLTERTRVFWGLLGNIEKADLYFEQTRVSDGVYLPMRLSFFWDGRKLFTSIREKITAEWSDYRSETAAVTPSSPAKEATKQ
jgi:hypothetical protein